MKTHNVFLALLLSIVVISVAGCISDDGSTETTTAAPTTAAPTTQSPTTLAPTTAAPSQDVEVISYNGRNDVFGQYILYGEVMNYLDYDLGRVKITASYYDDQDQFIGNYFTFTENTTVEPGQKSPFILTTWPDSFTPDKVDLEVSYEAAINPVYKGIEIIDHQGMLDQDGYYVINGEVQNNGDSTVNFVKLMCTYYDIDGKVIATEYSFTEKDELEPDETSTFEVMPFLYEFTPASYEIQVQANPI